MKRPDHPGTPPPVAAHASAVRRRIARRVAEAHRGLVDGPLLAFVSGSTVEDLADERSDVDMSVVLPTLPDAESLQAACARAGGTPWFWTAGSLDEGGLVVAFRVDGIETQIAYTSAATFDDQLDELLVRHNPDTPLHKLGEGVLKAEALAGAERLAAAQVRLAAFPLPLARAMVRHALAQPTPWRAIAQIVHRDAGLWCRELLVEAGYRLLMLLAARNGRYFTRFQVKRVGKLAASFAAAPPRLAERLDALLVMPAEAAFAELHRLEGEVLDLVAAADLAEPHALQAARRRRDDFRP